ncbi:biopolymer transporter ExbD [Roseobacter sp. HKCCD9010]|uniref:ExbD/TolR family protein n=1 Tax=unclassified Roseobacter TaxID=196798 RepID=UPI001492BD4F|nr:MULTISPECIES: biopolymer transporter ExbD [unclassified Roseobacter]MBF9048392.1 biopolymer transporter ExbD [Rhodobacterales bacterium HKCCD4356]NNV10391.1 biopolymer transporter ExbD [Roseobacter sp. HKCCD7357]NNV14576.1 biopolymer transporter ExbD [Roseobacter sp. HKCCD8768]NNV24035.1 biopolymer transporter ExbD [Roseobacter sp. HKCCD8192]NNV28292.1 biopolymer transporter ExbD [Roseobacter sp. HKCCD9061]
MSFHFAIGRPRRRPSLTPMIDVVFLLLVFFMLAARFGQDGALPLAVAGQGATYSGPPRLVDVLPDGQRLNGRVTEIDGLAAALTPLTDTPGDTIILRAVDGASLQRLVTVMSVLEQAGFTRLVLVE